MPMNEVTKELRAKLPAMNEGRAAIGARPLEKFEVSNRLQLRSEGPATRRLGVNKHPRVASNQKGCE